MESNNRNQDVIHSYLALRKAVGLMGILLPFVLMLGLFVFFHADRILKSISQYYHSGMRDVFVGTLCGIALFLFFYRGYDNWKKTNWDLWITNIGAILVIGIALFPAPHNIPIDWIGIVHYVCAISFFILLAFYSIFIFTKKGLITSERKRVRNKIFVICGLVMVACLIAIFIYMIFIQTPDSTCCFVFWGETVVLVAFGISWLTKGGMIYPDKRDTDSHGENN